MQLITLAMTLVTASVAMAQGAIPPASSAPVATPSIQPSGQPPVPAPDGNPGEVEGDSNCWYLRQPGNEWINVCSKSIPPYSQTVVPPPYTTSSWATTPTMTYKTHPHIWHQRPRKPQSTWSTSDVPIWW